MKNLSFLTEAELLETFRVSLENVRNQSEIAAIMAEFGYPSEIITEGESLFNNARKAYDHNKQEGDETSKSYLDFMESKQVLAKKYSIDRKIAKVVFRNDPVIRMQLALSGEIPAAYLNWLEVVRKLYQELAQNPDLQAKVTPLKISKEKIVEALNLITLLESSRSEYIKELGESQQSKVQKDHAFAQLESWMREFYAVTKIALEDNEGLLKAIRN